MFIVNPKSGLGRQFELDKLLPEHLNMRRYTYNLEYTDHAGHATEICKRVVLGHEYGAVVAVGGDGTVNEVATGLVGSDIAMGLLPTGSGNGLARYLGVPFNFEEAINVINDRKTVKIDTATMNGRLFVSIAGIGFDAEVANEFAKVKKRGFRPYLNIILRLYPRYKQRQYVIETPEKTIITKAFFISLANSNQFGYNATVAPQSKINDGLIDVCIFKKPALIEAPLIVPLLFFRKIDKSHCVKIVRTDKLTIKQPQNAVVHLDGDAMTLGKKLDICVNSLSLTVIVP